MRNKGFMLAEVIVVSVIIITTLTSLYTGINRIYKLYGERVRYNDVDAIYAGTDILKYMTREMKVNGLIYDMRLNTKNHIRLTCTEVLFAENAWQQTFCNHLKNYYNIEDMYFTKYDFGVVNIDSYNPPVTFKNYLSYLTTSKKKKDDTYAIIVETLANKTEYNSCISSGGGTSCKKIYNYSMLEVK